LGGGRTAEEEPGIGGELNGATEKEEQKILYGPLGGGEKKGTIPEDKGSKFTLHRKGTAEEGSKNLAQGYCRLRGKKGLGAPGVFKREREG